MREDLHDWQGALVSETTEPDDGGDVGGDAQQGTAWARERTTKHDHGVFIVCTIYWYASRVGPDDYCVVRQEQVTRCTDVDDVGSTETDSEVKYHTEVSKFRTCEAADAHALSLAKEFRFWN